MSACLPYIVVSVCVDYFHVDAPEPTSVVAIGQKDAPPRSASPSNSRCAACFWLRVSLRLERGISLAIANEAVALEVPLPDVRWPDSPVPHPSAFRGPPRPALS